jgi:hypothetical protein
VLLSDVPLVRTLADASTSMAAPDSMSAPTASPIFALRSMRRG